ncbi:MAG: 3',5'-cyclic-nucleotide phosphodiesterase [Pseudomonadota bacterium]
MIFQVLGCSGSECGDRHPCSFLVGPTTLADMGSAASHLSLEEQCGISDIFLSHAHLDHTKDLAFFLENVLELISKPVRVRGTAETLHNVQEHLLNGRVWADFAALPDSNEGTLKYEPFSVRTPVRMKGFDVFAVPTNHVAGSAALFFSTPEGSVLYSSDTGPTEEMWSETKKRQGKMRAILLEASFPNRFDKVAQASGHLTPDLFRKELEKIGGFKVPIFAYHMKAPYEKETRKEILGLGDPRVRILEPGMKIEF